jgi:hypothetical protein
MWIEEANYCLHDDSRFAPFCGLDRPAADSPPIISPDGLARIARVRESHYLVITLDTAPKQDGQWEIGMILSRASTVAPLRDE